MNRIERIQEILKEQVPEIVIDGIWGKKSQAALERVVNTPVTGRYKASSFADPADVAAFKKCKAKGKTDKQCFAVGDNGIGQFGANTAQEHTPMCALHGDDMKRLYGSIAKAAHQKVRVTVGGKSVACAIEDRMSSVNRIDLNPAAAKALGLNPPFLVACEWEPV